MASNLKFMRRMMELMRLICAAGFREWLEQADCLAAAFDRDGRRLRFKLASEQELGVTVIPVSPRLSPEDGRRGGQKSATLQNAVHTRKNLSLCVVRWWLRGRCFRRIVVDRRWELRGMPRLRM